MKTREHKIASIAKRLAQNGWSSIYSYVEKHFDEDDYDDPCKVERVYGYIFP